MKLLSYLEVYVVLIILEQKVVLSNGKTSPKGTIAEYTSGRNARFDRADNSVESANNDVRNHRNVIKLVAHLCDG